MAIEFLSKHTMHSDVTVEIAYSGEFFVRPLRRQHTAARDTSRTATDSDQIEETKEPDDQAVQDDDQFDEDNPPDDPSYYELVIDNDSGTYRPRADLLPTLHSYLASPHNFGALGRVTALNGFDERLKKWKDARKQAKKGEKVMQVGSISSASSSSSSLSGVSGADGVQTGDMKAVVEEDAKRARENDDKDQQAEAEEEKAGPSSSR
jgi:hypothetical protein